MDNLKVWLDNKLPTIETIEVSGEPDYYGASYIIARQTNRLTPARSYATWSHGWTYYPLTLVRQLVQYGHPAQVHLVASEDHVDFLRKNGFSRAVAVGLPYVYAKVSEVVRMPGSLLVMPAHSLLQTQHEWNQKHYVDQIVRLKPHFSAIVACVHSACVEKGYWTTLFEKAGIPWVIGASLFDKNALLRMRVLFETFEYMTTNAVGSHILYAAYSGCKASIYGTYASVKEEDYKEEPFFKKYPEAGRLIVRASSEGEIRRQYPEFFISPMKAPERRGWAEEMIGSRHKRSPKEIARLLGWTPWKQAVEKSKDRLENSRYRSARLLYYYYRRISEGKFWESQID